MTELSKATDAVIAALLRYAVEPFLKVAGIALCLVILLQIFGREMFDQPYRWTEEVSRMIFVWFSFVGAVYALAKGQHLGMSLILDVAPRPVVRALEIAIGLCTITFGVIVCYGVIDVIEASGKQVTTVLRLPHWQIYIVFPIMGAGFILCGLAKILAVLSGRSLHGTPAGDDTVSVEGAK